ncbi:hypothetical protein H4Q26_014922 [Puccinia striiformis f. sp. tritici PST-130]|nr:hypothetical protein H4Q26_014922 [Puccinia striiformis f. sp. tritici PST-130]
MAALIHRLVGVRGPIQFAKRVIIREEYNLDRSCYLGGQYAGLGIPVDFHGLPEHNRNHVVGAAAWTDGRGATRIKHVKNEGLPAGRPMEVISDDKINMLISGTLLIRISSVTPVIPRLHGQATSSQTAIEPFQLPVECLSLSSHCLLLEGEPIFLLDSWTLSSSSSCSSVTGHNEVIVSPRRDEWVNSMNQEDKMSKFGLWYTMNKNGNHSLTQKHDSLSSFTVGLSSLGTPNRTLANEVHRNDSSTS